MHRNSLKVYAELKDKMSARARVIHTLLLSVGAMTDRQVMHRLNYTEPNMCRPRCSELIQSHWCYEAGHINDHETGKRVRLVAARTAQERREFLASLETQKPPKQLDLFNPEQKAA